MDGNLSKYTQQIAAYIQNTFPHLFLKGDDREFIKKWFYQKIPEQVVKMYVTEISDEGKKPKTMKTLYNEVMKKYKEDKKKELKLLKKKLKSENFYTEKLDYIYEILHSILISLPVDNVIILDKLLELKECELEVAEKELYNFEKVFYSYLFQHTPEKDKIVESVNKKLEKYKFYWEEKIYNITRSALIKKYLKEKYGIPDFTLLPED